MAITNWEIPREEFIARQKKCAQMAKEKGLSGLLVWSKGGGTVDRYGDVLYLSNHYSSFPHIPDNPPAWAGRACSAVIIPAEGDPALLVEIPDYRRDLVAIGDVRYSINLPELAARTIKEKGMAGGKVGLVASETMLLGPYKLLLSHLPNVEFVAADDILTSMRVIKSPNEIKFMRKAGEVGSKILTAVMEAVEPGKTEAEVILEGLKVATLEGAATYDFPTASGPFNQFYCASSLPSWDTARKLKKGEIFHVDMYGAYQGYYYDFSRTTIVGGEATAAQKEICEASKATCEEVIKAIRPGVTAEELAFVGMDFLKKIGYAGKEGHTASNVTAALAESFPSFGHSIGLGWEAPWLMPGDKTVIRAGMCLAIERAVGNDEVGTSAFEENLIVTESGAEVVSVTKKVWW
ncbi:MAG: M24 family metallopeptidase [Bacillota bacterium]